MKDKKLALIVLTAAASVLRLPAAVPLSWTVETTRATPATFEAYQGETLTFEAALTCRGKPLEAPLNYSFFWQTNGMGNLYWEAPCTVPSASSPTGAGTNVLFATFDPSMDVGAKVYNCFIGSPSNNYHAAFQLRLRPSPGASPNTLPLPVPVIDFARVRVLNPPWGGGVTPDDVREIAGDVVAPVRTTANQALALGYEAATTLDHVQYQLSNKADKYDVEVAQSTADDAQTTATAAQQTATAAQQSASSASASVQQLAGQVDTIGAHLNDKADADDVRTLNEGYQRLYAFSSGATNANISVTNYPPTAAESEGRTHFDPTDPDLDFSTMPASMRLDETRDGEKRTVVDTRDFPVWWWFQKAPKLLAAAQGFAEEKCAALFSRLAAWADRTARGLENPAGESTLVIDVPNIWLMTDQTFEKHVAGSNSCWVIRSKNAAVSPNVATNGFLELTDAFGTPYIRFNKTEATFADPPASGIRYDDEAGEWLITYTTENKPKGGANLTIEGSADYPGKAILKEEGDELCPAVITWTGSKFNWIMHAKPKPIAGENPSTLFFAAVVEIEGQDYIEYLKPVSFSHIVVPNGRKIAPVVPASATVGSTVEWKVVQ